MVHTPHESVDFAPLPARGSGEQRPSSLVPPELSTRLSTAQNTVHIAVENACREPEGGYLDPPSRSGRAPPSGHEAGQRVRIGYRTLYFRGLWPPAHATAVHGAAPQPRGWCVTPPDGAKSPHCFACGQLGPSLTSTWFSTHLSTGTSCAIMIRASSEICGHAATVVSRETHPRCSWALPPWH